jgi:hypothetical protein
MVDDIFEIGGREPQVESMQNRPHTRYCIVEFEVSVRVPAKTGDPIPWRDAKRSKGIGQLTRSPANLTIICAVQSIAEPGHDLYIRRELWTSIHENRHA